MKYPEDFINKVIQGDCLGVMKEMPLKEVKSDNFIVITDPPYPDYHTELYGYKDGIIDFLNNFYCRQFIFWSAKVEFPLNNITAIHIWNKKCGVGSMYERIFERYGGKEYKVFNNYLINSDVAAQYTGDIFFNHPSQKPIKLMEKIINNFTKENDIIFDPFCGTGSTLLAAKHLKRNFIGIEISPEYCEIARNRLKQDLLF